MSAPLDWAGALPIEDGLGVNVVAAISNNVGLGMAARNLCRALEKHDVPFAIADIEHDWGRRVEIGDLTSYVARYSNELRFPLNLYVLSLSHYESLFTSYPFLLVPGRLHVGSFWWEASAIPRAWIESLSRLDAVMVSSGFLANLAANSLELTPVIEATLPVLIPEGIVADRARFGMPADATVFTASFDPNSDPARKNPLATIAAFHMAFPGVDDVRLAIRMNNAETVWGEGTLQEMKRAASTDTRISFLLQPMEYDEILTFYASGDVFVSLHRGEGLGLPIIESMALGKPVVATAWSGSTDLLDHGCGCPVRYRRTPVRGNWRFFKPEFIGPDAFWAEPMVDDAAAWMRKLHGDPGFRARLGSAARARADAYMARAWGREWIDRLAGLLRSQAFLPQPPYKYSALK